MAKIRYGIVGAGVIAGLMARAFTEDRDSVAAAVADTNIEAARKLATAVGAARAVADYRELLEDPGIDALYIATPPFLHRPMALAAIAAGKHVCVEKPFMLTQAEVREIAAAQRAAPGVVVTCNSSRFHDSGTARRAREIVASGRLGALLRVHFEQVTLAPKPGSKLPPWRNDPSKNGGGISFDWGPYDLDWMCFVLGGLFRPKSVFATLGNYFPLTPERVPPCLDVDGRLCAEILCEGGLTIHWERRAAEHGPERHLIELRGTKAGLDTVMVPMGDRQGIRLHAYEGAADLRTEALAETLPDWGETLIFSIRDLSRAILDRREPSNTLANSLRIHGVLDAVVASARTGQPAPVAA